MDIKTITSLRHPLIRLIQQQPRAGSRKYEHSRCVGIQFRWHRRHHAFLKLSGSRLPSAETNLRDSKPVVQGDKSLESHFVFWMDMG